MHVYLFFSKIILVAISDEGSRNMTTEAYDALSQIAATDIGSVDFRGSLALIGFSEQTKPSFVKHVCLFVEFANFNVLCFCIVVSV